MSKRIVIIGGGLAGLSTAYHLDGASYELYEKGDRVGGLCRSHTVDGFTFDFTGHLLHFRKNEIREWVQKLLGGQLIGHGRKSCVFSKGVITPYPFQANTFGLPLEVVKECLMGYIETLIKNRHPFPSAGSNGEKISNPKQPSFEQWILQTFGEGIARHFMIPFNEKLWKRPLKKLTSDWVSWLVPKPNLEDVVNGALGIKPREMGYNPSFFYPRQGGIESLPRTLGSGLKNIYLNQHVEAIHTKKKLVVLRGGEKVPYDRLVNTMPVPRLIECCSDLPPAMKRAASRLAYVSVYNINLGVSRENISPKHWIYFPEKEYPFYRVGFPMNFSDALVPTGTSSIYVEISHLPGDRIPPVKILSDVRQGLDRAGILFPNDEILVSQIHDIPYAYVIFDSYRQKHLPVLLKGLAERGIDSIGRYGAWEHTSMEDALWQGKTLARRLLKRPSKVKS